MAESSKVTAWVAVKIELEPCEVWAADLPCTDACSYEHEHECCCDCGCQDGNSADDCWHEGECHEHEDDGSRAYWCHERRCGGGDYDHGESEGHRPDWSQIDLNEAMLGRLARDYESGSSPAWDPETRQWVPKGAICAGSGDVEAWQWKAVLGTAQVLSPGEAPAVTPTVTERSCACGCGQPVTSPRPEAKYATGACRVRAHRSR